MGCTSSKAGAVADGDRSQADWMRDLPDHLRCSPLYRLAIPGSHDSGTSELSVCEGVATDCGPGVRACLDVTSVLTCCVAACFVRNWSKCQDLDFRGQLYAGVRYFDVRVGRWNCGCCGQQSLHCVHGLRGASVLRCMQEVKVFLDEHPGEVVLLDFNRFHNMEDVSDHQQLAQMLDSVFSSLLCRYTPGRSCEKLSLDQLCSDGGRVLLFYYDNDDKHRALPPQCSHFWPYSAINSQSSWANATKVDDWKTKQADVAETRRYANKFYVCQGNLTPDTPLVLKRCCCTLLCCGRQGTVEAECADKVNPVLVDWVGTDVRDNGRGVIYTADFVHRQYYPVAAAKEDEKGSNCVVMRSFVHSVVEANTELEQMIDGRYKLCCSSNIR